MRTVAVLLALALGPSAAHAEIDDATRLVRVALAEARWSTRDRDAIWHTLGRWQRRTGKSLRLVIHERVTRFSRRPKAWITRVEPSCRLPAGFPAWLSWGAHSSSCWAYYAAAGAFLRGELADPCRGRAEGWRSPAALPSALARGRRLVW